MILTQLGFIFKNTLFVLLFTAKKKFSDNRILVTLEYMGAFIFLEIRWKYFYVQSIIIISPEGCPLLGMTFHKVHNKNWSFGFPRPSQGRRTIFWRP